MTHSSCKVSIYTINTEVLPPNLFYLLLSLTRYNYGQTLSRLQVVSSACHGLLMAVLLQWPGPGHVMVDLLCGVCLDPS